MTPMHTQIRHPFISPETLQAIGYVFVTAGTIEFYLERSIWRISGEQVAGIKPTTDTQPISTLIKRMTAVGEWNRAEWSLPHRLQLVQYHIPGYEHVLARSEDYNGQAVQLEMRITKEDDLYNRIDISIIHNGGRLDPITVKLRRDLQYFAPFAWAHKAQFKIELQIEGNHLSDSHGTAVLNAIPPPDKAVVPDSYYFKLLNLVQPHTKDHIIPLPAKGIDATRNKVESCLSCNKCKAQLLPEQFLEGLKAGKWPQIHESRRQQMILSVELLLQSIAPYRKALYKPGTFTISPRT